MSFQSGYYPLFCLLTVLATMAWSWINPYDRFTWWLESIPAIVAVVVLTATYKKFRLTDLLYGLIALHCIVLLVGGHYTYARVPLFDDLSHIMGWERNHYDRVGHIMQGLVPAVIARELLIRTSTLQRGAWMMVLIVMGCLGIGALYEIIEWAAAALTGEAAESFLGTQGDIWDTQKDMALAGIGAVLGLGLFSIWHDRQLRSIK
jgi:putative membrane protein